MSTTLIATSPAPLLNTPEHAKVFGPERLSVDAKGHIRALEMIALPRQELKLIGQVSEHILEIRVDGYPKSPLYIDARFTKKGTPTLPKLPPKEEILKDLLSSIGLPYLWGGNWSKGISLIDQLYPENPLSLKGVDCSGLLYGATRGFTPRNTEQLLDFGQEIFSLSDVKPLDILVWPGHVLIAIDKTTTIESKEDRGVILAPLLEKNIKSPFLIKRFI